MAVTTRDILVRASAGDGDPTPVPAVLIYFCELLQEALPTTAFRTANRDQDLAQLHAAAQTKASQYDMSSFGLSSLWTPVDFHEPDPTVPYGWMSNSNTRGIRYQVTLRDGTNMFVLVYMQ